MTVLVTGGIIGGLFWYDGLSWEDSVSGGVRAGLPEGRSSGSAPSSQKPTPYRVTGAVARSVDVLTELDRYRQPGHPNGRQRPERERAQCHVH
ncbi:hypothetical protein [Streptomyces hirsutus]|uniref:hypothetical protein n=1 Tax=Streptomyces hirsutus TaxID=35620 RepID=UPI0033205548